MTALESTARRFIPDRTTALWAALLIHLEVLLVAVFLFATDVTITAPRFLVYPFIWINLGIWAVTTVTPPPTPPRTRRTGIAIGIGYFVLLAVVGGLIGFDPVEHGFRIAWELPPGWGPAILYQGDLLRVALVPYKLIGYLALAYLVYTLVLDAAGSALTGLVGLFSCVSCTWPVLGTVISGLFGSSSVVAAVATNQPYGLSTFVFVTAVGLLVWRPFR